MNLYRIDDTFVTLKYDGELHHPQTVNEVTIGLMVAYCRAPKLHDWLVEHGQRVIKVKSAKELLAFKGIYKYLYDNYIVPRKSRYNHDPKAGTEGIPISEPTLEGWGEYYPFDYQDWQSIVRPYAAMFDLTYMLTRIDNLRSNNITEKLPVDSGDVNLNVGYVPDEMKKAINNPLYADYILTNGTTMMYAHSDIMRTNMMSSTEMRVLMPSDCLAYYGESTFMEDGNIKVIKVCNQTLKAIIGFYYTYTPPFRESIPISWTIEFWAFGSLATNGDIMSLVALYYENEANVDRLVRHLENDTSDGPSVRTIVGYLLSLESYDDMYTHPLGINFVHLMNTARQRIGTADATREDERSVRATDQKDDEALQHLIERRSLKHVLERLMNTFDIEDVEIMAFSLRHPDDDSIPQAVIDGAIPLMDTDGERYLRI